MKLKIENLKKSYGTNVILKGVSLDIESGSFISLLGPSGSGKTTILRCIAGLETADAESGEMKLGETVLSGPGQRPVAPEKRQLGMVFQNYAVWPHLNVLENVAFPLHIQSRALGLSREAINKKAREAIENVHLSRYETRFAHELSGGQQQRVALARALAMNPKLLLLDEPLSNLDAILREELGTEIRRLQQELQLTTVLVTHDQKEALSLSDRIVVLNGGAIEASGAPEELYRNPPTQFVAEFLSSAQSLSVGGTAKTFLPRRWNVVDDGANSSETFEIASRIYLGSEYEYWAKNERYSDAIRFYSRDRFDLHRQVSLSYEQ